MTTSAYVARTHFSERQCSLYLEDRIHVDAVGKWEIQSAINHSYLSSCSAEHSIWRWCVGCCTNSPIGKTCLQLISINVSSRRDHRGSATNNHSNCTMTATWACRCANSTCNVTCKRCRWNRGTKLCYKREIGNQSFLTRSHTEIHKKFL